MGAEPGVSPEPQQSKTNAKRPGRPDLSKKELPKILRRGPITEPGPTIPLKPQPKSPEPVTSQPLHSPGLSPSSPVRLYRFPSPTSGPANASQPRDVTPPRSPGTTFGSSGSVYEDREASNGQKGSLLPLPGHASTNQERTKLESPEGGVPLPRATASKGAGFRAVGGAGVTPSH